MNYEKERHNAIHIQTLQEGIDLVIIAISGGLEDTYTPTKDTIHNQAMVLSSDQYRILYDDLLTRFKLAFQPQSNEPDTSSPIELSSIENIIAFSIEIVDKELFVLLSEIIRRVVVSDQR